MRLYNNKKSDPVERGHFQLPRILSGFPMNISYVDIPSLFFVWPTYFSNAGSNTDPIA